MISSQVAVAATGKPLSQKTVLVVDDSSINIFLIEKIVHSLGHKVISIKTGAEALHILSEHTPHLILLDIMMPEMDGFELLSHIKQIPELAYTPVIFISSLEAEEYKVKGLLEGGYDYIAKPLKVAEVQARILAGLRVQALQESLYREKERLAVLNQGLEHFASIAAHDLQAPSRKIALFTEQLMHTAQDRLTEEDRDLLVRIARSSAKMQTLVKDLLTLSRMEGQPQACKPVDLHTLIAEILDELKEEIEQSKAQITLGELPVVQAEPGMVRQLFTNLIGNAIKYAQPNVAPVIKIERVDVLDGGGLHISVSDNGIGIEARHLDNLFKPFQRFQGSKAYSGTGLGLYICQQIVQRYGGNITVSSIPCQGSIFTVNFPCEQA